MNRRLEDQMALLAFGELSEREAEQLRALAQTDPEAQRLLASYEGMRDELRLLRDVPPEQLSSERLQDAILQRGLTPKRDRGWIGWVWLPVGVAVAAFLITGLFRNPDRGEPAFVGAGVPGNVARGGEPSADEPMTAVEFQLDDWQRFIEREAGAATAALTERASVSTEAAPSPAPVGKPAARAARTLERTERRATSARHTPRGRTVARRGDRANPGAARGGAGIEPARPYEKSPVVVISSERDVATGASRAFEIDAEGLEGVVVSS